MSLRAACTSAMFTRPMPGTSMSPGFQPAGHALSQRACRLTLNWLRPAVGGSIRLSTSPL